MTMMDRDDARHIEGALNSVTAAVAGLTATVRAEGVANDRRFSDMSAMVERRFAGLEEDIYSPQGALSRLSVAEDHVRAAKARAVATGGGAGAVGFGLLAVLDWIARHLPGAIQ